MITRIFFDLDECLLHSEYGGRKPEQECFSFADDEYPDRFYHTIFNPLSYPVLDHARKLVGADSVYVLTSSIRWYAQKVCAAGNFGFRPEQIFTREDLHEHRVAGAYGASIQIPHPLAHANNVLIDNLPPRYNQDKMSFLGMMNSLRYIQVRDYYGVNFPDDCFADDIIERLNQIHELKA